MDSILEILLTGFIDPLIWIKSMSALGCNKSKGKYFVAFLGYYILLIGKGLAENYINSSLIDILARFFVAIYIFAVSIFVFKGTLREKVINICIFCCILFIVELIVIESYSLFMHGNWSIAMSNKTVNFVCGFIAKLLQAIICCCLFCSEKIMNFFYRNKERMSLIIIVSSTMLSSLLLAKNSQERSSREVLIFEIIQILFLWHILSSVVVFKRKDKCILDLNQEVNNNVERQELVKDIEHFKHDFSTNVFIMKNLCYYKEYEKLGKYMDEVFEGVERAELLFDHPNVTIRILISGLIQRAKKVRIPLSVGIQVNEFGMDDEDICSILQNLVVNGLEAAAKVPRDIAHVSLQVLYTEAGYEIRCINDCVGVADFKKTSKLDTKNHGFGVAIVDKIVKKYHGTVERVCTETDKEGIGLVIVSIQIWI